MKKLFETLSVGRVSDSVTRQYCRLMSGYAIANPTYFSHTSNLKLQTLMKPIYFPFTSIPETIVNSLSVCFKPLCVYQPYQQEHSEVMRQWEAQNRVKWYLPIRTDAAKLNKIVRDYQAWMKMHERSGGIEYFKTRESHIPFFDEFSTAHIKTAIAQRAKSEGNPADTQFDSSAQLLEAIVFLCIAQEFDQYQNEIAKDLSVVNARQQEMYKILKGELEDADSDMSTNLIANPSSSDDLGQYQTLARIQAWVQLWMRDYTDDCFFLTDSPAVMEYLTASVANLKKAFSLQLPSAENNTAMKGAECQTLIQKTESLMRSTWLDSTEDTVDTVQTGVQGTTLTCYISPDETPEQFFMHFLPDKIIPGNAMKTDKAIKNTLIGLIEI